MTRKTLQKHLKELRAARDALGEYEPTSEDEWDIRRIADHRLLGSIDTTRYYLGLLDRHSSPTRSATRLLTDKMKCFVGAESRRKK